MSDIETCLQLLSVNGENDLVVGARDELKRLMALATARLKSDASNEKNEARLKWLHDCSTGQTDLEGYEWGIYRVKWENGKAVSVLQTNSDLTDLDSEMARELNTSLMRNDLHSCPFCGGDAEFDLMQAFRTLSGGYMANRVAIYCTKCTAQVGMCHDDHKESPEQLLAILMEAWNERVPNRL